MNFFFTPKCTSTELVAEMIGLDIADLVYKNAINSDENGKREKKKAWTKNRKSKLFAGNFERLVFDT